MTDGDIVCADFRRYVQMSHGKLGGIEWRIEIEVVHAHEKAQVGVAGESAGKARVVVPGGCERADSAARQGEDSVVVAREAAGEIALIEVDGDDRGATKAAAAAPSSAR